MERVTINPRVAASVFRDALLTKPSHTKWAALKRKAGSEVCGVFVTMCVFVCAEREAEKHSVVSRKGGRDGAQGGGGGDLKKAGRGDVL